MRFKKISTRMLTILLFVTILSMVLLAGISYKSSKGIIDTQVEENMQAELSSTVNAINLKMQEISSMSSQLALNVGSTYKTTYLSQYEEMIGKTIFKSDLVLGAGIWFEPYVYDASKEYVGPYIHKKDNKALVTYDYSNAEYNYFNYKWYKNAKNNKETVFSDLYYDETLDTIMSTCATPIYDADDNFIGVISVDMEIPSIQDLINNFKIGENGKALLINNDGKYITNSDYKKIMKTKINEDDNKSLSEFGNVLLNNTDGKSNFSIDDTKYEAYYTTVDPFGWKLFMQIPISELNKPINDLMSKLIVVGILAIILTTLAIIWQVQYLTKTIKKVNNLASNLSNGDFSIDELEVTSNDELGQMSNSLNKMLSENKNMIQEISNDANKVNSITENLNKSTEYLVENYKVIKDSVKNISESMLNSSATTEEVNASVEEVNSSISLLSQETIKSHDMAKDIKVRAYNIEKMSNDSYNKATSLSEVHETNLKQSIENAKIVENIGAMAKAISDIAEQVNLLSLNASIEAARAGEQGKGFAVVASEIGNLATQTSDTVKEIIETISKVQEAFNKLTNDSTQMLLFIKDTVTPDYKEFVGIANQYDKDANAIEDISIKISEMTNNIEYITHEVGDAIQNIAEASQNTASNSGEIVSSIELVSQLVEEISTIVENEIEISDNLNSMVKKFTL
ncbi:methyl-accepting chemotaxis protein [Clostridium aquiflavi]|uniref:Methyl-accepting chemotaxis protein n=1 Tax=Clostridium aquiflavi TaxID=3073603 RepID=A0ABU1EJ53_9CLOT|nr:methyl-accepting chemotaxis protein [Clostridium sp. 5N-1]MDR5588425.1 methyl-accepting chemotaxis protein [Clostridium sp. 5N-1]